MLIIESKTPISGTVEPVTLAEAQIYFRSEDSDGLEDNLIEDLVSAAREYLESRINRSLIGSDLVVTFVEDFKGWVPYGPVNGAITWVDTEPASTYGQNYPYVQIDTTTKAIYKTSAYSSHIAKQCILELALFYYERGSFDWAMIPIKTKMAIQSISRVPAI